MYRPLRKYIRIDKQELVKAYAVDRVTFPEMEKRFQAATTEICFALKLHKIQKRPYLKKGGKRADVMRSLKIGDETIFSLAIKNPHVTLHNSAKNVGIKFPCRQEMANFR